MTTALTAFEGTPAQIELVKNTICRGATDDELAMFLYTAKRTGLDPLLRQIHAVKRWDKKLNRETMAIQTGIDGLRLIADRTGLYAGNDEPAFEYSETNQELPMKASVTVYKLVSGVRCGFTASARWSEYCPKSGNDFMWLKMPHVMLGKCAEALALRKAFPAEIAGLYTTEEMQQADTPTIQRPQATSEEVQPIHEAAQEILGAEQIESQEQVVIPEGFKLMKSKYAGICKHRDCQNPEIKIGQEILYSKTVGVRHVGCV